MLKVTHLHVRYGPVPALMDVTLRVDSGAVVAVLGANGAGKSSLLRAISCVVRDVEGAVEFDGQVLVKKGMGTRRTEQRHWQPHRVVRLGIAHVPEGRQIFNQMTVAENLQMGAFARSGRRLKDDFQKVYSYFPVLADKRARRADALSGGEQQMLAIGRALMLRPRLLLLDEPSVGLSPRLRQVLFEAVEAINKQEGCGILLVEQDAESALAIAKYGYVLESPGHVALEGPADDLKGDEAVKKAYLGR